MRVSRGLVLFSSILAVYSGAAMADRMPGDDWADKVCGYGNVSGVAHSYHKNAAGGCGGDFAVKCDDGTTSVAKAVPVAAKYCNVGKGALKVELPENDPKSWVF